MGYTEYKFYTDKYYGDSIAESSFPKWNDRASEKLDSLTYGNITEDACTIRSADPESHVCAGGSAL